MEVVVDSAAEKVICCWTLKKWTKVIGWLIIIGFLLGAFVGIIMTATGAAEKAWLNIVIIYTVTGLAVVIHVLLLMGNQEGKAGYFVPWLICTLGATGLSFLGVFKLVLVDGDVPGVMILLAAMHLSAFSLHVVYQRYKEINVKSGCCVMLKWPGAKNAKV